MDNRNSRKNLNLTKIILFILILGFIIVGKRITTWPIMTWPVYSTYSRGFPESTVSTVELRVHSISGDIYILKPTDIMPRGRTNAPEAIFEDAFESDDLNLEYKSRAYLARTVTRILENIDIESIEGCELVWNVSPLSVPPLIKDHPVDEIFLGSFLVQDYLTLEAEEK